MNIRKVSLSPQFLILPAVAALLMLSAAALPSAHAQATETILYSFTAGVNGYNAVGGLISDAAGNLYGTTYNGGTVGDGTVFELSPGASGWTETVLHSFDRNTDGRLPSGNLIFDAAGSLYGTTSLGGPFDGGMVFELSPAGGGLWTENVLHQFGGIGDGSQPAAGLVFDAAGDLFGTTMDGGAFNWGSVFELAPQASGVWRERVLHSFNKNGTDGFFPSCTLAIDAAGNLYGTTRGGGSHNGGGTVFELIPRLGGGWSERILIAFSNQTTLPNQPYAGVTLDTSGDLYGTTFAGGMHRFGSVFELIPASGGQWNVKILHNFNPNNGDGSQPQANLIFDSAGNLYGTTNRGGSGAVGTVFKLTPRLSGNWSETILHNFNETNDGSQPLDSLTLDAVGNLYGTTFLGGVTGAGTVFKITP